MQALTVTPSSYSTMQHLKNFKNTRKCFKVTSNHEFPSFLPKQIHKIKDPFARNLAIRIEQLPVQVSFFFFLHFFLFYFIFFLERNFGLAFDTIHDFILILSFEISIYRVGPKVHLHVGCLGILFC